VGALVLQVTWRPAMTTPISDSQLRRLRQRAKALKREMGIPLYAGYQQLAEEHGYANWEQLIRASSAKTAQLPSAASKPEPVATLGSELQSVPTRDNIDALYAHALATLRISDPQSSQAVVDVLRAIRLSKRRSRGPIAEATCPIETSTDPIDARRVAAFMLASLGTGMRHERLAAMLRHKSTSMTAYYVRAATTFSVRSSEICVRPAAGRSDDV
jgi:hypothetical protein